MTTNTPDQPESQFISTYKVGDKIVSVDALLVFSELTLANAGDNPTNEHLMAATKASIRPVADSETLTPAELLALSLRIAYTLKSLGNAGAP